MRTIRGLFALVKLIVGGESSWYLLAEQLSTRNEFRWNVLVAGQVERVFVVADFDWSYVLLRIAFSVYSIYKA